MPAQSDRWERVAALFDAAVALPRWERTRFLEQECTDQPELRAEIESLLAADEEDSEFLEDSPLELPRELFADATTELRKQKFGAYRIIREIGHGGLGTVYLGQRADEAFEKEVAIKAVRRGLDTDDILRRFRAERQILAQLDHPNIARLIDAGSTDDGLPFFVMEYVQGEPISAYCDTHQLGTDERLELFRKVCSAVTYAHQRLVIHRDIKPSNILVTADGEPKLLDFGIAKLLSADDAMFTQTAPGLRAMTPEYASPEQVRGLPITTSTDIYSLGVLLYELLTGQKPYRLTTQASDELSRAVLDQMPERPSTAITRSGISPQPGPSRTGGLRDPKSLRGDLDNIVLMALRKEPERRYASAGALSEDIGRHLACRPVVARKDTFTYRASRFVKRNQIGVTAAAFVVLTLCGGILSTTWQARRAEALRIQAEKRFNEVRGLANSFLFEVEPQIAHLQGATAARRTLVKRALEYLDRLAMEGGDDPSLQHELALAYLKIAGIQGKPNLPNLGDSAGAIASLRKAQALLESLLARDPANHKVQQDLGYNYQTLGEVLGARNRDQLGNVENQRKAVALFKAVAESNPDNAEYRHNLVRGYNYLASASAGYAEERQSVELVEHALEGHRHAIAIAETLAATYPENTAFRRDLAASYLRIGYTLHLLGHLTGRNDNYREALRTDRKAQEIFAALSAADPTNAWHRRDAADAALSVGDSELKTGDPVSALESFAKAASTTKALAEADPLNTQARLDLAVISVRMSEAMVKTGNLDRALELSREAVSICNSLRDANPEGVRRFLIAAYEMIGDVWRIKGDTAQGIVSYRDVVAMLERWAAAEPANAWILSKLGRNYANLGSLHAMEASRPNTDLIERQDAWRAAKACYQQSSEIWHKMKEQGTLAPADAGKIDEMSREITKCSAALLEGDIPKPGNS